MKLDAIPSQNPCFPKTNWHSKGGLPGYLSKIGVFQKKRLKSSKIPDFSKVLALQNSHEKRSGNHLPNKINLRKVVHLILHLRRGRLLHVLRSINQRRWCFPCMTGIECPILLMVFLMDFGEQKYGIVGIDNIMK